MLQRQQLHSETYVKESAQAQKLQSMTQKYESLRQKYDQVKEKHRVLKAKLEGETQSNQALLKSHT